jgi:hypothetical protein
MITWRSLVSWRQTEGHRGRSNSHPPEVSEVISISEVGLLCVLLKEPKRGRVRAPRQERDKLNPRGEGTKLLSGKDLMAGGESSN